MRLYRLHSPRLGYISPNIIHWLRGHANHENMVTTSPLHHVIEVPIIDQLQADKKHKTRDTATLPMSDFHVVFQLFVLGDRTRTYL